MEEEDVTMVSILFENLLKKKKREIVNVFEDGFHKIAVFLIVLQEITVLDMDTVTGLTLVFVVVCVEWK
jgi:hypothetical protein